MRKCLVGISTQRKLPPFHQHLLPHLHRLPLDDEARRGKLLFDPYEGGLRTCRSVAMCAKFTVGSDILIQRIAERCRALPRPLSMGQAYERLCTAHRQQGSFYRE